MAAKWIEIEQVKQENRYELVLSGAEVSSRIEQEGLSNAIFKLSHINFLEISKTSLQVLPDAVGELVNLTHLVLHTNQLTSVPTLVGRLTKLKGLDLSSNKLESLPIEICGLSQLQNLNISSNKLKEVPDLGLLEKLITLDSSRNELETFPLSGCNPNQVHLSEIRARENKIGSVPHGISAFVNLRLLDLESNELAQIPGELGDCGKLKELSLKGNKLVDKRLQKLVDQCHAKQVLEYIRAHCPKDTSKNVKNEGDNKSKSKKGGKGGKKKANDEMDKLEDLLQVLHVKETTPIVIITEAARDVRPFILCCILRDLDLETGNKFKKFIIIQTKLHDNECEKRNAATIATHDLSKIQGNLTYDAQPPADIKIVPLMRQQQVTAEEFYDQLRKDADALRKEKKRNTYSGIHKYLYLLQDQQLYPCLMDELGQVISFPPITNSDITKISHATKDILIEVTSSVSLNNCKKVLDNLLVGCLKLGLGKQPEGAENDETEAGIHYLSVEQVKIVDKDGHLRSVYPSRADLQLTGVRVQRDFE